MKFQTAEEIKRAHLEAATALADQYGKFSIPAVELEHLQEMFRARHGLLIFPDQDMATTFRYFSISPRAVLEFGDIDVTAVKKIKGSDKYKAIQNWCEENVGAQVTPAQVSEIAGFSYSTAVNYINSNVGVFSKVKRGLYEIRDPKVEREREKNAA